MTKVLREHVEALYRKLSDNMGQTPEAFYFDDFELRGGDLYYKGKSMSLMIREGKLRLVRVIVEILGKEGLPDIGFSIPRSKVPARQAVMLNKAEGEMPSTSDVAKAEDIELQGIMENASRSTENLIP